MKFNLSVRVGGLFPLDGCRRLGGDVVGYAVDAADFVDDLVRYFS